MRKVEWTAAFRRDYNRTRKTPRHKDIEAHLSEIASRLGDDRPLKEKQRDHPLVGNWIGHRECHIKPDLLLIYKLPDDETVRFVRMGSHSELFAK